ncbi:MAG TPA: nuclear transport factor 2 family protein [Flavobacterium sp.]|jgi:ketosteroid isomerase-like protein
MKKLLFILLFAPLICSSQNDQEKADQLLTAWHKAAATAKFDAYFAMMTADAIFIGTDPTENWNMAEFKAFAKPYFDRGRAWNFSAVERNIFISPDGTFAWFDELLDTPNMKLCRGSGALKKIGTEWKIIHYVLSMTVPNENTDDVVKAKSAFDDALLIRIKANKK